MSRKNRRKKARNTAAVPEGTAATAQPKKKKGPAHGLDRRTWVLYLVGFAAPGLVLFYLIHPQLVGRRLCLHRPGYGSLALVFV